MRALARIALAAVAALAAFPAAADRLRGDGDVVLERREVPAFTAVALRGALDLEVKVGAAAAVVVRMDKNLLPHVSTRVEGGTLVVEASRDIAPSRGARVEIATPALRRLAIEGSGDATIEGGQGDLDLSIRGSGDLSWRGEAGALAVAIEGSGDAALSGRAERLRVEVDGAGDVAARGLSAGAADVRVSGSGNVQVSLAGGPLRARVSGSGDVTWWGDARLEDARASGAGEIRRGD